MKRIVIGISGASGAPLAIKLLKELRKNNDVETHLVMTNSAQLTIKYECKESLEEICRLADVIYDNSNLAASISSGTFQTNGMIVIPCSMKTVAGIAHGYSDNVLLRACDVMIKEHRKLILAVRESPLSCIHLDNLAYLSKINNIMIMPLMMTYYNQPKTIEDMENHLIGKICSQFQIEIEQFKKWK